MDPASYKDFVVSRGYKYHYYAAKAKGDKFTLLFVYGFPSLARDWNLIVPFFEDKGYGVIAPDMLAYGDTDKPTDPEAYQFSLLTRDFIDLMDAESVQKAVAIGHDWYVWYFIECVRWHLTIPQGVRNRLSSE